eukprot:1011556_1
MSTGEMFGESRSRKIPRQKLDGSRVRIIAGRHEGLIGQVGSGSNGYYHVHIEGSEGSPVNVRHQNLRVVGAPDEGEYTPDVSEEPKRVKSMPTERSAFDDYDFSDDDDPRSTTSIFQKRERHFTARGRSVPLSLNMQPQMSLDVLVKAAVSIIRPDAADAYISRSSTPLPAGLSANIKFDSQSNGFHNLSYEHVPFSRPMMISVGTQTQPTGLPLVAVGPPRLPQPTAQWQGVGSGVGMSLNGRPYAPGPTISNVTGSTSWTMPMVASVVNGHLAPNIGGSSCHQCKRIHQSVDLKYCQQAYTRKHKLNKRVCRKKYCYQCLQRFYLENPLGAKSPWVCPACRVICTCAVCKRRRLAANSSPESVHCEMESDEDAAMYLKTPMPSRVVSSTLVPLTPTPVSTAAASLIAVSSTTADQQVLSNGLVSAPSTEATSIRKSPRSLSTGATAALKRVRDSAVDQSESTVLASDIHQAKRNKVEQHALPPPPVIEQHECKMPDVGIVHRIGRMTYQIAPAKSSDVATGLNMQSPGHEIQPASIQPLKVEIQPLKLEIKPTTAANLKVEASVPGRS